MILRVDDLRTFFPVRRGLLKRKVGEIKAVDGVSFSIQPGTTLGLVGESGSGKSTVARTVLRLYQPTTGTVEFKGRDITRVSMRRLRPLRRHMPMVFQDPGSSLDPRKTVGALIGEPLLVHKLATSREAYRKRIAELIDLVGLPETAADRMPHEFSGGQRQRVAIARAIASEPDFLVLDEAVSALDVSVQAQIVNLLEDLQARLGIAYLFIAHDLSVVRHISDQVAVMYLGRIVEIGNRDEIFAHPRHPYTRLLLSAVAVPDPVIEAKRERVIIRGELPSLLNRPRGCHFSNRCPLVTPECHEIDPPLVPLSTTHAAACIRIGEAT